MFAGTKLIFANCFLIILMLTGAALGEDHMTAEDVLRHYLDSIGTAPVRAAAKSRVVEGTTSYRILVGGSGQIDGKAVMVSDGRKMQLMLKINAPEYAGERFICDGEKTSVAGTYSDKHRSEFGEFLRAEDLPLREGLLGGVLSTSWSLLDLDARKGKLKYQGLKKIDGTELYAVAYQPKKNTDLQITLYFEPETFRHVRTVYTASVHAGLGDTSAPDTLAAPSDLGGNPNPVAGGGDVSSARQQQTRYRIEERFSDFKTVDGLSLSSHYDLRFQEELGSGFTKTVDWDTTTTQVLNNVSISEKNFEIH